MPEIDFFRTEHYQSPTPLIHTDRSVGRPERLAILETKFEQIAADNAEIKAKLNELLELKHKGFGALWLVGLVISTGLLGGVLTVANFFNKGHL